VSSDRRVEPRLAVSMRVRYRIQSGGGGHLEFVEATSQNIGLGGLMLIAQHSFGERDKLSLEIYLQPNDREPILAEGAVQWQSRQSISGGPGRFDTGVRFRFVKNEGKRRFLDFTFRNQDRLIGLRKKKF
jgi:hypothetical protein